MLPGRTYKPEDYVRILRRRIWLLLVTTALVSATTAVIVGVLPDRYQSDTLILIVPQRVPESYVRSTITSRIEDRLRSISQQILSRTRLERTIEEFDLYADKRDTEIMEDIVEQMRRDIKIDVVRGDAFRVSYVGEDPATVMRVTERLASSVIDESLRDRDVLAEGTTQFLEGQLEDARRRLMEHEKKLETYRRQFSGELPTQMNANIQSIQNIQLQIQSLMESLNRDRDQRRLAERRLADLEAEAPVDPPPGAARPAEDAAPPTTTQQLASARATLESLELRLKPTHPDIGMWKRRIRDLERRAEAEALDAPLSADATKPVSPAEALRRSRIAELQGQLQQLDSQIAFKEKEEVRLRGATATYEQRVERAPTRESELVELTRDYETLQSMYTNLLAKKEEAKMSANLERRQVGEQFRLLDPARMPEKPISPKRGLINLAGAVFGLLLALGCIAVLEYRDSTFRTEDELSAVLQLPVLAVVPVMLSTQERQRLRVRRWFIGVGLGSTVAACLAVVAYTFVR